MTFLLNSSSANAINIGDIRKIIPIPDKGKATSNKKKEAFSEEFTMNVKTYREFSHYVIYHVSKSSRSSLYSLVDRGVNGGIIRSDVRVVETCPDRKVEIHVI